MRTAIGIAVWLTVGLIIVALPDNAWAWGAGAHLKFGEMVLLNRALLPAPVAALIGAFPGQFLYGNIIADLILGKAVGIDYRDHSHNWEVGYRLLDRAHNDPLRAVMTGYLCHLAADVVAHNVYVPGQFLHAAAGRGMGHAFWEMHYDAHVPDRYIHATAHVQRLGRDHADDFLFRELVETVFSHGTNRWIFSGVLVVQRMRAYREFARRTTQRSTFRLAPAAVHFFDDLSLRAMHNLLSEGRDARVTAYDPTGRAAIERAKAEREAARRSLPRLSALTSRRPHVDHEQARDGFLGDLDTLPPHPFTVAPPADAARLLHAAEPDDR